MVNLNKVLSIVGSRWLERISSEEIEQEKLIVQWKYPGIEDINSKVTWRLLMREYALYKTPGRVSSGIDTVEYIPTDNSLVTIEDFQSNEVLVKGDFTPYERYVVYLLYHHNKAEVAEILQCRFPYLSKLISKLKVKLLTGLSSLE